MSKSGAKAKAAKLRERRKAKKRGEVKTNKATKIPFAIGTTHGHLYLIRRLRLRPKASPNLQRVWWCRCEGCGTELEVPQYYMERQPNPKTHCGCLVKTSTSINNREYRIWLMMHSRCYDPRHEAYEHYHGRGIGICDEWRRPDILADGTKVEYPEGEKPDLKPAFERFFAYIGPAPSKQHSVDRKDNDKGYEPGNVRWATVQEQADNRRPVGYYAAQRRKKLAEAKAKKAQKEDPDGGV